MVILYILFLTERNNMIILMSSVSVIIVGIIVNFGMYKGLLQLRSSVCFTSISPSEVMCSLRR